jgi:hypothetical protein
MKSITMLITFDRSDYAAYGDASRLLQEKLGAEAPDVDALIRHELSRRKPHGIVEAYLYSIGWYDPRRPQLEKRTEKPSRSGVGVRPARPRAVRRQMPASSRPADRGGN